MDKIWLGVALRIAMAVTICSATFSSAAQAGPKTVIELFTSQGCSSCPPADALLQKYAARDDIIALSLPVDYWDNLGWKDTLANPANTKRQRLYAETRGDGQVYTPQTIVNGGPHAVGSSEISINQAIEKTASALQRDHVDIRLRISADGLLIDVGPAQATSPLRPAKLVLALVQQKGEVAIGRGENSGRTVTYHNVVRFLRQIGNWSGAAEQVRVPISDLAGQDVQMAVVMLQDDGPGPIVGAESINLTP